METADNMQQVVTNQNCWMQCQLQTISSYGTNMFFGEWLSNGIIFVEEKIDL